MDEQWNLVEEIKKLSVGERAALRREAGGKLCDASGRALAAFYRIIPPGLSSRKRECWFCVLTIACLWNVEDAREGDSMPELLRQLAKHQATGGMDARIRSLLDTRWEEDGYLSAKLCRLARMLRSDNWQVMPDADSLLTDVLYWNNERRTVQLRWAQRYFQTSEEE